MNNFMRFFNKNQKNIFLATAVVIFVILIIVILNQYYIAQEENNQKIAQDKQLTTENGYSNQENVTLDNIETESVKKLNNNTIENTMKKFVSYCNSGDYVQAYNIDLI